jgi:cation-transporting P-type ATPase 13A2
MTVATYIAIIAVTYKYSTAADLIQKFVTMVTITIPPQIPVSMTFGIIYAVERLSKKGIYCIEQNKVIVGGSIELCCFDKTGTLTEDYMDLYGIVPAHEGRFHPLIVNNEQNITKTIEDSVRVPFLSAILSNMASNNSIIKIEATNELIGDPMEIKAF